VTSVLLNILFDIAPLFAGLLVVTAQIAPVDLVAYLDRYFITIFTFIVWSFSANVIHKLIPQNLDTSYRSLVRVLCILFLIGFFGVCLLLLQKRSDNLLFQFELFLFVLLSLSYRFHFLKQYKQAIPLFFLFYFGSSLLSFQFSVLSFSWQLVAFCIAFSACLLELRESLILSSKQLPPYVLAIGVSALFLLVFSKDLPSTYLLTGICLIPQIKKHQPLSAWIFLAILIVLSFF
jgi:hypothetical protein